MRGKISQSGHSGRKYLIKVRYLVVAVWMTVCGVGSGLGGVVEAVECPDLRVVFARGSGGERYGDQNFVAFRDAIESKIQTTSITYETIDLDYPAVGISDPSVLIGAYIGAGEAYEFGESVQAGVRSLTELVNGADCPSTKYVIGGYSQGAMVVSRAISGLKAERVIYAATFGDPKIYLPEGAGLMPAACRGENLSDYRMYVPDCQAYKGLLGANEPYEPAGFVGKVGTWCNKRDIFCSSHLNISDHVSYVADDLYEDASKVIFDKICSSFGVTNTVSSAHDTVILIDSTASMKNLIRGYKAEAMRLAEKTLASGGRVALYDYRDYKEGYVPKQWCDFTTCTMETVADGLAAIEVDRGSDTPESLLASSIHVMQELEWKQGSVKSIVVLTDAGYHEPDYDIGGTTRLDVVRMSKQIDPVNFYVVTTPEVAGVYADLTSETGGRVVTTADDLTELTDYIMARYDALPRVEEVDTVADLPVLSVEDVTFLGSSATVRFASSNGRALVVLNDGILGVVEGDTVTVRDLDSGASNKLLLVSLGDDVRGEGVEVLLNNTKSNSNASVNNAEMIPKAPNTGKH